MEIGKEFVNLAYYNQNMSKGLEDKLFFLNHLDLKEDGSYIFVDFGCADGTLINALYEIMDSKKIHCYFIGYDISETMIELAKTKFAHDSYSVMFTTSWDDVKEKLSLYSAMEGILILSSVIHEIFSYSNGPKDIFDFFEKMNNRHFRYICVRDMMCSKDLDRDIRTSTDVSILNSVLDHMPCGSGEGKYLREFEKIYGSIRENMKNLVHYLLKYRWKINWDREVHENYFASTIEEFVEHMQNYNVNYLERFRVPFLEKCWKDDFGVVLQDYTHVKIIFERKK